MGVDLVIGGVFLGVDGGVPVPVGVGTAVAVGIVIAAVICIIIGTIRGICGAVEGMEGGVITRFGFHREIRIAVAPVIVEVAGGGVGGDGGLGGGSLSGGLGGLVIGAVKAVGGGEG
jgi:hypothetical protein